jgi:hypothetical protein
MSPLAVIAVVPEIHMESPATTAREYPRSGSNGEPERMFVRTSAVAILIQIGIPASWS